MKTICVCVHMRTHTHFNALFVSNELNLIYRGHRYYRGSMWGHLRIQKELSPLHSPAPYYSRHCWSFNSFWSGLESNRKLKRKDTLKDTHMKAGIHKRAKARTQHPHIRSHTIPLFNIFLCLQLTIFCVKL